ncbi:MAG TPA: hypothetical protein VF193_14210 [Steroidobacter sp.]
MVAVPQQPDLTTPPEKGSGSLGLMPFDFNAPKPEGEDKKEPARPEEQIADNLGRLLAGRFQEWSDSRREQEEEWLKDLRAFNGMYEPEVETKIGNKTNVYMQLTRMKTLAAYARLIDMLLGHDRHWAISATPVPELAPWRKEEMRQAVAAVAPDAPPPTDEDLVEIERINAKKAAEEMQQEIDDQLTEAKYESKFKVAVMEGCLLGSGCLKGPVVRVKREQRWQRLPGDRFALMMTESVVPGIDAPSIFDVYPDPYITDLEDATGVFERHVMAAMHLRGLTEYPGFSSEAIEEIIAALPNGNHVDMHHETERRHIAKTSATVPLDRRYDVLEYWGQISGADLAAAGVEVHPDKLTMELQGNVWFCAMRTIKVQLNPLKPERLPYQIWHYEKVPHKFWGNGVPREMRDTQMVLNAAVRAMLDNAAVSSGPQAEVNLELLAPGEDPKDLHPWRVWLREGGDPSAPLLRFYKAENITEFLVKIIEMMRKFMDEETNLPSYTHGEQMPGLNKTASGLSMLMGASNVALKAVVKNIDDGLIEPTMRGMYHWNMQWNDKAKIKGDMNAEARGSTALLAKEIQSQRILQYLAMTGNPFDQQLIGPVKRAKTLRSAAIAMDLDPDEVGPDEPEPGKAVPGVGADGSAPGGAPSVPAGGGSIAPPNSGPDVARSGAIPQPAAVA